MSKYLSRLPKAKQDAVIMAVEKHFDDQKESQLELVRSIVKSADRVNMSEALNSYIRLGEASEAVQKGLAEAIAKEILSTGCSIEKATTDLVADQVAQGGAGLVNQAYGNMFFENAVKESSFFSKVDVFQMAAPKEKVDRFERGARFLYKGNYDRGANTATHTGRALNEAQYFGFTVEKTEFEATEYKGVIRVNAEDVKDNIMGAGLTNYILNQAISQAMPYDMADLLVNGDTTITDLAVTADPNLQILQTKNGVLKLAGYEKDCAGAVLSHTVLGAALKLVAPEHQRRMSRAELFTTQNAVVDYMVSLGDSATSLGFMARTNGGKYPILGTSVSALDEMPARKAVLLDPKMVKFGVWEAVEITTDFDVLKNEYLFVVRTRFDFKVMEPEQVVRFINVGAA